MRRWLLIFLLMFMPLQAAWSAASVYCTHHEEGTDAMHFGHHSDGHADSDADGNPLSASGCQSHGHHHGGTLAIVAAEPLIGEIPSAANAFLTAPAPRLSPSPGRIERPKWTRLA